MVALKVSRLTFYAGVDGKFTLTKLEGHKLRECIEKVGNDWYYSRSYIHPRSPININDVPEEIMKVADLASFLVGD